MTIVMARVLVRLFDLTLARLELFVGSKVKLDAGSIVGLKIHTKYNYEQKHSGIDKFRILETRFCQASCLTVFNFS